MASIRQSASVASAVCKQTVNPRVAHSVASVPTCSPAVSLSSATRLASSPLLQSSHRLAPPSSYSPCTRQTRTFLTQLRRQAQALKEQPISSNPTIPSKPKAPKPALQLTNLPYFVRRTGSNQLPVYLVTKAGGTKQLTKIQKTEGDLDTLRSDLAYTLGVDQRSSDVSINRLNGHIIVKGWRKPEIVAFLQERNF
ncbi:Phosphopantothenoylcysteine decarboxylase [Penicillium argentinense]|uniref:Large ribosomal subunit protein mL49 n=1 Tax=Penicillium argentinense TaxID=1131581 RepID=A0A9W9KF95_9EURO|nr:Phosphopantothenoylcysteine decarboxylase [Penicillium argentinense]KAJ5103651.1 Phosphopantothenoylcysteine decarboxylase [Penicillium argentinense]